MIITPVLTMRVLAEEKKQKTDQLLLTAPISVAQIVAGKYLALAVIFFDTHSSAVPVPSDHEQFWRRIPVHGLHSSSGILFAGVRQYFYRGLFSSVTESQIIAAVLTFAVLFVSYMMSGIEGLFGETAFVSFTVFAILILAVCVGIYYMLRNAFVGIVAGVAGEGALLAVYLIKPALFEGAVQKFLSIFDLTSHFSNFVDGMLDFTGIVYYLSVILIFLFLTVQSIQKRRWS